MAIDISGVNPGDPQGLIDELDGDVSTADLLRIQSELSLMMMKYTAYSSIVKAVSDCESGIARNMC